MDAKLEEEILEKNVLIEKLTQEIHKKVIWQEVVVRKLLVAILAWWHILLEWVPWIAKTLTASTIAKVFHLDFKRIQFTPDLLPSDLVWTEIFNMKESKFSIKKWPIFTNILLADEINRAPSKVQSALLEAMAEKQITIWDETFILDKPFIVLATQNPIEQNGTYKLPEAELDRFMMKLYVDYPSVQDEKQIIKNIINIEQIDVQKVITKKDLLSLQDLIKQIYVSENIIDYIFDIVSATREKNIYLQYGVSPRAWISLIMAAKALAFLEGRSFVIPEDIKWISIEVLAHRLVLSYEAIAENISANQVISEIVEKIKIK